MWLTGRIAGSAWWVKTTRPIGTLPSNRSDSSRLISPCMRVSAIAGLLHGDRQKVRHGHCALPAAPVQPYLEHQLCPPSGCTGRIWFLRSQRAADRCGQGLKARESRTSGLSAAIPQAVVAATDEIALLGRPNGSGADLWQGGS